MLKISRESEINLINVLIDNDVISGKDLIDIKKKSTEGNKSQIEAVFDLKLTDDTQDKLNHFIRFSKFIKFITHRIPICPCWKLTKSFTIRNY